MIKKLKLTVIILIGLLTFTCVALAEPIDLAKDYYTHNLNDKAKELFIGILYDSQESDAAKAEALYWLGQISFQEGRYSTALNDWRKLIKKYPQTTQAREISDRLKQLNEIISKPPKEHLASAVAKSYLNNGDFWSKSDETFTIDATWLPKVEMAIEWYDRTINEFPKSAAAEIAYQKKLFALLGWKDPGDDGAAYGLKADFGKYMPQVLATFAEFENNFPESSYLQAFRYQIAQAFWEQKDWENTKLWLQKIIDAAKGEETFYTQTAKARLNNIEY